MEQEHQWDMEEVGLHQLDMRQLDTVQPVWIGRVFLQEVEAAAHLHQGEEDLCS